MSGEAVGTPAARFSERPAKRGPTAAPGDSRDPRLIVIRGIWVIRGKTVIRVRPRHARWIADPRTLRDPRQDRDPRPSASSAVDRGSADSA